MPLPHSWIDPAGDVRHVTVGHWDLVPAGMNFADMYEKGWIRIGGFGGFKAGEYTQQQGLNFVQGRLEDITRYKDVIGYMLVPGERIRIAFHEGGATQVTSEEFWDSDIESLAVKAGLLAAAGDFAWEGMRRRPLPVGLPSEDELFPKKAKRAIRIGIDPETGQYYSDVEGVPSESPVPEKTRRAIVRRRPCGCLVKSHWRKK